MNVFELSRNFWDWSFENPDKIKPIHSAMYFFAIEHCNRLGWKEKFGFPTSMVMDAIGVKSYNTFISALNDLVKFGFIKMVEKSKNQYSANIIALSNFNKALDKALDKALIKHSTKQSESTVQSIDSIDIPIYNNTNIQYVEEEETEIQKMEEVKNFLKTKKTIQMDRIKMQHGLSTEQLHLKIDEFVEKKISWNEDKWRNESDLSRNFEFWLAKNPIIINNYQNWTKETFFEEVKKAGGKTNKQLLQRFFDVYKQTGENGKMRFQNRKAWDTATELKIFIQEQNKTHA